MARKCVRKGRIVQLKQKQNAKGDDLWEENINVQTSCMLEGLQHINEGAKGA